MPSLDISPLPRGSFLNAASIFTSKP
jgi:hypothetical protein